MMLAAISGRLGQDPRTIETKTGKPMCVGSVAVDLPDREGNGTTQWFGLVAFGRVADLLAKHSKGDFLSVSGRVQMNSWTGNDGTAQVQLQVVADAILSARAVRPGGKRKASGTAPDSEAGEADFNDDVPF